MKTSPTQRSLKLLRDEGYTVQVVEKWQAFAKKRVDLFGCIDIIAIKDGVTGVLGVQTTSGSNLAAREKKARAIPALTTFLDAGNSFELHGWSKKGKAGKRKLWTVTRKEIRNNTYVGEFESTTGKFWGEIILDKRESWKVR